MRKAPATITEYYTRGEQTLDELHVGPALTHAGEPTTTNQDGSTFAGNATRGRPPPGISRRHTTEKDHHRPAPQEAPRAQNTHQALPRRVGRNPPSLGEPLDVILQGGNFKKLTTPMCRYRPILRSWVFTRSLRAVEHHHIDARERCRRGPKGRGFPPGKGAQPNAITPHDSPTPHRPHDRGSRAAPEPLARPPTKRTHHRPWPPPQIPS